MKLETLSIKGLLRFTEPVTLDLRDQPPGIIALTGPCGEGKTTTLEGVMAALFRKLPSRDGELLDYVTRTDGFIDTTFELEGRGVYRARLNLDGPHRKAEGVLSCVLPDGTQAFLNDGKVTTYDAAVAKLLPPEPLMLASVFAAQNRAGSFASLDRKKRKDLFASLLGLDHYEEMAGRAKTAAGFVQQSLATLSAIRDVLAREAGEPVERELEQRTQQLQADGGTLEVRRVELQRDLHAIETELATLQDAATVYATAKAQADRLDIELATLARELDTCALSLDRHSEEAHAQRVLIGAATAAALVDLGKQQDNIAGYTREVAEIEARLRAALADAEERIAGNRKLLDDAGVIRAAVAALDTTDAAITVLRHDEKLDAEALDSLRKRDTLLSEALNGIAAAEGSLTRATTDAALLTQVPFGEKCAPCQFMTNATDAQAKIPRLQELVNAKPAAQEELNSVRRKLDTLTLTGKGRRATLHQYEAARVQQQATANRAANLEVAETRIKDLEGKQADARTEAARQTAAAQAREVARVHDLQDRRVQREQEGDARLSALAELMDARLAELTASSAALTERIAVLTADRQGFDDVLALHAHASDSAAAQRALLTLRQREWDQTTGDLARITSQREDLDRRRQDLAAKRGELQAAEARIAQLQTDLVEWTLLAKALGRDGLPVIEIDAAGPAVSAIANDLLRSCYGARFTLDLVTQVAKLTKGKDGSTMKDDMLMLIFDAERGGEQRDIADLSGGERVIVEEVLRSAIAVLVNQKNQHPIRTLWRDECTGALDAELAPRYVAMLRRLREVGGFFHVLMITHSDDCALLADAQVRFGGGKLELVQPPYGRAEAA